MDMLCANTLNHLGAIDSLLSDKSRLQTMGVASRQRALAEFDYDVLTARLAAVLGVNA